MFFDKYLAQDQFIWVFKNDLYFTRISKKIQKRQNIYISLFGVIYVCVTLENLHSRPRGMVGVEGF